MNDWSPKFPKRSPTLCLAMVPHLNKCVSSLGSALKEAKLTGLFTFWARFTIGLSYKCWKHRMERSPWMAAEALPCLQDKLTSKAVEDIKTYLAFQRIWNHPSKPWQRGTKNQGHLPLCAESVAFVYSVIHPTAYNHLSGREQGSRAAHAHRYAFGSLPPYLEWYPQQPQRRIAVIPPFLLEDNRPLSLASGVGGVWDAKSRLAVKILAFWSWFVMWTWHWAQILLHDQSSAVGHVTEHFQIDRLSWNPR